MRAWGDALGCVEGLSASAESAIHVWPALKDSLDRHTRSAGIVLKGFPKERRLGQPSVLSLTAGSRHSSSSQGFA